MNGASMTGEKLDLNLVERVLGEHFRVSDEYRDIVTRIDHGTPVAVIHIQLTILENSGKGYEIEKPKRSSTGWGCDGCDKR